MKAAVAHALRKREPMTVLFIDLNDLRVHNNTRGHEFGDQVLVALASAMRASSWRVSDVLARTGGDEFAMVLPDTDVAGAVIVADRLISGIETRYVQHGEELVPIGISVGGAILSTAGDCPPRRRGCSGKPRRA
jgi:diguanylate cyclase (GGDEF)-like protein